MAYELKDGQGTLFRNNKKPEGSKQPDARGELMIDGVLYEVAGWIKEGKSGKWTSLSVKPKEDRPAKRESAGGHLESDIPFARARGNE